MPAISLQEQGEPPLEPQVEQQEDLNDDELLEEDLEEEEEELGQEDFEEELDELAEDLEDREGADGHREERRLLQERLKQAQQELEHFRQQEQQEMLDTGEVEASRAFCLFCLQVLIPFGFLASISRCLGQGNPCHPEHQLLT